MADQTAGATAAVVADDLTDKSGSALAARMALVAVGVVILAWMIVALILADTRGSEKHAAAPGTAITTSTTTTTATGTGTTPATGTTTATTATTGAKTDESSTSAPSDTVLVALLTIGAILVLCGALYTRLATVKLGTGFEVTLNPEEAQQVADHVAANAASAPPADVAHATAAALEIARQNKAVARAGGLSPDALEHAALTGLDIAGVAPRGSSNS